MSEIHIHVHDHVDTTRILGALGEIASRVEVLISQGAHLMTVAGDIQNLITQIDEATNEVASDLQALRDQLANGVSAEDAASIQARLDAAATRLRVLGADPENPVPAPPTDGTTA